MYWTRKYIPDVSNDKLILTEAPANSSPNLINKLFSLYLNVNSKKMNSITYEEMESLLMKEIELDHKMHIDQEKYMSGSWWCLNDTEQINALESALAKRGIRERYLAKNLNLFKDQLNDKAFFEKLTSFLGDQSNSINNNSENLAKKGSAKKLNNEFENLESFVE